MRPFACVCDVQCLMHFEYDMNSEGVLLTFLRQYTYSENSGLLPQIKWWLSAAFLVNVNREGVGTRMYTVYLYFCVCCNQLNYLGCFLLLAKLAIWCTLHMPKLLSIFMSQMSWIYVWISLPWASTCWQEALTAEGICCVNSSSNPLTR